jgi:hypothetical protein
VRDKRHEPGFDALRALPSRRDALVAGAALITAPFIRTHAVAAQAAQAPAPPVARTVDWASYAGDKASAKYSALA